MSPGFRYEDLARLTAAAPGRARLRSPRDRERSVVRVSGGTERIFVTGVTSDYAFLMDRPVGLRPRRSPRTISAGTRPWRWWARRLASKLFGGIDPVGRDMVIEGVPYRIVGVLASSQIFNDEMWLDANGVQIPLETYMDRMDPNHQLTQVSVKLRDPREAPDEVGAAMLSRDQAGPPRHRGRRGDEPRRRGGCAPARTSSSRCAAGRIVLYSLAGTVLLVGGVGVLSVMLISFSDRRYEIGLRKAMGADDDQILVQFLLEALVLAAIGASIGTVAGSALCNWLSPKFPYGLVVNPIGLLWAWVIALVLALVFGLYPAIRAARLSPMEAMR